MVSPNLFHGAAQVFLDLKHGGCYLFCSGPPGEVWDVMWRRCTMDSVAAGWTCPAAWSSSTAHAAVICPQPRRRPAQTPGPCLEDAGALLCARHVLLDQKPSLNFNRAKYMVAHLEAEP